MSREVKLHAYLAEAATRAFEPGTHDCALFVAGWIDRIRGTRLVDEWSGRYDSLPEGRKLLAKSGRRNLRELAKTTLPSVGGWAFAQPGDVALIKDHTLCFGLIGSGGSIHILRPVVGLDVCPQSRAWEVFRP